MICRVQSGSGNCLEVEGGGKIEVIVPNNPVFAPVPQKPFIISYLAPVP
jgi:hypothetical protein